MLGIFVTFWRLGSTLSCYLTVELSVYFYQIRSLIMAQFSKLLLIKASFELKTESSQYPLKKEQKKFSQSIFTFFDLRASTQILNLGPRPNAK